MARGTVAFLQKPYVQEADLSHTAKKKKKLWLIFILFIFDLCAAYEATKADRNPLNVYEALLNQQLCNIKQESKYSHRMLKKNHQF